MVFTVFFLFFFIRRRLYVRKRTAKESSVKLNVSKFLPSDRFHMVGSWYSVSLWSALTSITLALLSVTCCFIKDFAICKSPSNCFVNTCSSWDPSLKEYNIKNSRLQKSEYLGWFHNRNRALWKMSTCKILVLCSNLNQGITVLTFWRPWLSVFMPLKSLNWILD